MAAQGNNIYIGYLSGGSYVIVAATKSNELTTQCETIEKSSASQQDWREYLKGRKEWSMTVSFLVTAVSPSGPTNPLSVGTTYTLRFMNRSSGSDYIQGQAICTQCKITSSRGNLCNGTITFKGTGSLA